MFRARSEFDSQLISFNIATFYLPVRSYTVIQRACTRHAATLDTGLVASGYPGGSLTHLFSNHFQYARAPHCSRFVRLSALVSCEVEPPV